MSHPYDPDRPASDQPDGRSRSPQVGPDGADTRSTRADQPYPPPAYAQQPQAPVEEHKPTRQERRERDRPGPDDTDTTSGADDQQAQRPLGLLEQEKAAFGGVKVGSAFFGWLTAVGTIALLAGILTAVASGLNLDRTASSADLTGVGLGAAIALVVVLFLGYLAGGYVAGRMARFQGVKQGVAVWLWGLLIAIVLGVTAAIVGEQSTVTVSANLPSIPFTGDGVTWQSIVGLLVVLVVTLLGAVLGGLLGMRFHRRVDRFAAKVTPHS